MKVARIETLHCDAGWRNYSFVKLTTDDGIVGWSEFDEGFGSPGVTSAIEQLAGRVVGQEVSAHERVYAELYCVTRPAAGGVVAGGALSRTRTRCGRIRPSSTRGWILRSDEHLSPLAG